jgi:hypothetical protein
MQEWPFLRPRERRANFERPGAGVHLLKRVVDISGHAMLQQHRRSNAYGAVTRQLFCCVVSILMLLNMGCTNGPTRKTKSVKSAKNLKSSPEELALRNQSLLGLYSAKIESAADKIILESPSPAARRQALIWKAEAIPVMQTSLLNTDPVAAVLDTWVFIFQMTAYMNRPMVKQQFGEFHSVVDETLKNMNSEMEELIRAAAPSANIPALRQRASSFAEAHPIQAGLAGRRSVTPELVRQVGESDLGTMASIKALGESLGDLTARLDSYNAYLPKQVRWQSELLLQETAQDPQVKGVISDFKSFSDTLARTSSSMEQMPDMLGQARKAVRADIEAQRLAAQDFVRGERIEALDNINRQRIATIADLRAERLAATADLRNERGIVVNALHDAEVAATTHLDATSEKTLKDLDNKGRGLINHLFLRAIELIVLTVLLFTLAAWMLLRRFASSRNARAGDLHKRAA